MTKEEYDKKTEELRAQRKASQLKLDTLYALENSPVGISDIVTDHYKTIRVEGIVAPYGKHNGYPQCIYHGVRLTKAGKPFKKKKKT